MELVQSRIITDDVERLAGFYARLIGVPTTLNEYYVEVHAGPVTVGFSRRRYTEYDGRPAAAVDGWSERRPETILDFLVDDADAEWERIEALRVECVMPPTTQPWGTRGMIIRDPEGNLINVFSRPQQLRTR